MGTIVADCSRCKTQQITFDLIGTVPDKQGEGMFYCFCQCRRCDRPSVFSLAGKYSNNPPELDKYKNIDITHLYNINLSAPVYKPVTQCPDFVPEQIKLIFDEGALCLSVGANDASGAMSRKVLDAATRELIGVEPQSVDREDPNYISWKQAKDLRLRLDWLFERGKLPAELKELASCVHQDGNDAAHSSENIGPDAALDLQDFSTVILESLYTRPGRIQANVNRRDARRGK